ncbi:hypothetical protein CSB37_01765 [bacterium DOLZORAL124_38_8]|nr:MAG: hypothetical protein CSB37_01765 [bacterium DOLZORAL124_38_8]
MKAQPNCKTVLNHLNRIIGQLEKLKTVIQENDCDQVTQLTLASANSFQTLKSSVLELFLTSELIDVDAMTDEQQASLEKFLKLSKY